MNREKNEWSKVCSNDVPCSKVCPYMCGCASEGATPAPGPPSSRESGLAGKALFQASGRSTGLGVRKPSLGSASVAPWQ